MWQIGQTVKFGGELWEVVGLYITKVGKKFFTLRAQQNGQRVIEVTR